MAITLTKEQFQNAIPKTAKIRVTEGMVSTFNNINLDDEFKEHYRTNVISYASVLMHGKFKITDYIHAIRYVTYKMGGDSNVHAFTKAFPDKYQRYLNEGKDAKTITAYASMYHAGKLVQLILEQQMIPIHMMYQDVYHQAIAVSADLMHNANSEKVRQDAAATVLRELKAPESAKLELEIGVKQGSAIDELAKATASLVEQNRQGILNGSHTAADVAQQDLIRREKVIDAEYQEV